MNLDFQIDDNNFHELLIKNRYDKYEILEQYNLSQIQSLIPLCVRVVKFETI